MECNAGGARAATAVAVLAVGLACAPLRAAEGEEAPRPAGERAIEVRISWGHTSDADTPFRVRCVATGATIADGSPRLHGDSSLDFGWHIALPSVRPLRLHCLPGSLRVAES